MSKDEERSFLESVIPIFSVSKVKILWSGVVKKIGQSNKTQPRLLVIASPGIFLIHQRNFAFQSHLVASISFYDLNSIFLSNFNLSLSGKNSQIRIRSDLASQIAMNIFMIRQALFPTDVLPLNVSFSDDGSFGSQIMKPLPLDTLFLDRTLSCILFLLPSFSKSNENMLSYVINNVSKTITIDQKFISSPVLQPIMLSLAYEQDVNHLHLKGIKFTDFLNVSGTLIRVNRFIKHITLENIDFTDADKKLEQTIIKKHALKPNWWSFVDCNLTTQNFLSFFEMLSLFDCNIAQLEVIKCIAGDMVPFFQTLFFNDSFHSLQMLKIDSIDNPSFVITHIIELAGCSWALEKKCLHQIILNNLEIDASFLMQQLFKFDFGLKYIDLSGNNCEAPLQSTKGSLQYIGLSSCRVTSSFMTSLFNNFSGDLATRSLDISNPSFSNPSELNEFIDSIENVEIQGLETLNASSIEMNSSKTEKFASFLSKQKKLKTLILDNSISIADSPEGLSKLSTVIHSLPLKKLSFACDSLSMDRRCGELLIPLFTSLNKLSSLDLTNQMIGERGLDALSQMLDSLDELFFDGSGASLQKTLSFCKQCLESRLKYTKFPTNDIKRCFSGVNKPQNYTENLELSKELENAFSKKYHRDITYGDNSIFLSIKEDIKMTRSPSSITQLKSAEDFGILSQKIPEIQNKYKECVGNDTIDSIISFAEQLEVSLSIPKLIEDLK